MRRYLTQIALRADGQAEADGIKPVQPTWPAIRQPDTVVNPFETAPDSMDPIAPHYPTSEAAPIGIDGSRSVTQVAEKQHESHPDTTSGKVTQPTIPAYRVIPYLHDTGRRPLIGPDREAPGPPDSQEATGSSTKKILDSPPEPKASDRRAEVTGTEPQTRVVITERIIHESAVKDTGSRHLKPPAPERNETAPKETQKKSQGAEMQDPLGARLPRRPPVGPSREGTVRRGPEKPEEARHMVQPRVPEVHPTLLPHSPPGFRTPNRQEAKRLVIGNLRVEVVTSEPVKAVPARQRPVRRNVTTRSRGVNSLERCKLQYGLGQV